MAIDERGKCALAKRAMRCDVDELRSSVGYLLVHRARGSLDHRKRWSPLRGPTVH